MSAEDPVESLLIADDDVEEASKLLSYTEQVTQSIQSALNSDSRLFSASELTLLHHYQHDLSPSAQVLVFRLLNRQRTFIRVSLLRESIPVALSPITEDLSVNKENEIICLEPPQKRAKVQVGIHVCRELERFGMIDMHGPTSPKEALDLLQRQELMSLCTSKHIKPAVGKCKVSDLRALLLRDVKTQRVLEFAPVSQKSGLPSPSHRLLGQISKITGPVLLLCQEVLTTFQYVNIIAQRMTSWPEDGRFMAASILSNLKTPMLSFYPYKISKNTRIWTDRTAFLSFYNMLQKENELHFLFSKSDEQSTLTIIDECSVLFFSWLEQVQSTSSPSTSPPWFKLFTSLYILTRIINLFRKALHRAKEYEQHVEVLKALICQDYALMYKRGVWYDELTKSLVKLKRWKSCEQACKACLSDPVVSEASLISIRKRMKRIESKIRAQQEVIIEISDDEDEDFADFTARPSAQLPRCEPPPVAVVEEEYESEVFTPIIIPELRLKSEKIHSAPSRKASYLSPHSADPVGVEEFALLHYQHQGWHGIHCESSIVRTLFGLLFWDIIFKEDVPGVFASPYQRHPLDMFTEFFSLQRSEAIQDRLRMMKDDGEAYLSLLESVYDREGVKATQCIGVNWDLVTKGELVAIARCFGGPRLACICNLFAHNYQAHSGGVPDLCLWRDDQDEIRMVEVKGKGDRLSGTQTIWLQQLKTFGVPVEVCYVDLK